MRKEQAVVTSFGRYRLHEFNYKSRGGMLDKFVKVYVDEIDVTEVISKVTGRRLSKDKKCFNSFYNLNCYGFSLSSYITDEIKNHQHEVAQAAQIFLLQMDLKNF